MCNATVTAAQRILDALSARIANNSVFTAFDVTVDARDGTDETINHRDARDIVHNEYDTGEFPDHYNVGNVELDVVNSPVVIVYFPDGKSPEDHPKARKTVAVAPNAVAFTPPVAISHPVNKTKLGGKVQIGDSFICNVTCDGRINVPKELYSKVSPQGGTYDIDFNGSILYKKPIGSEKRLVLKKSDLAGGQKFRISVDNVTDTIIVEQI